MDIDGVIKEEDSRGVDDSSAGLTHPEIVEGDTTTWEAREGVCLVGGKVGFLQTQDVGRRENVANTGSNELAAEAEVAGSTVVRQTVDVVGNNAGNGKRKVGEETKRRRGTIENTRATKH